jgi:hypothetical protein
MALSLKRLIVTAGTVAGLAALGMPVAAHASTRSAQPTIVSVQPAAAKVPDVAGNGNGKSWTVTLSNGAVCSWVVGDHAMADYSASGEADIKCPYAYAVTEKVNLDYAYASGGAYSTGRTTGWQTGNIAAGTYLDLWTTPGVCWPGAEPVLYWTTYAWISIGGSPTYEAWSQPYKIFEPVHC